MSKRKKPLKKLKKPLDTFSKKRVGRPGVRIGFVVNAANHYKLLLATYAPPGELSGYKNGGTQASPLVTTSNSFDKRMQPIFLSAATTAATVFSLGYDYHLASGDNGQVLKITNNIDNGRTQTYVYDNLRRLSSATSQATSGADCWGQSFGYDRYANLLNVTSTQCSAPQLTVSDADANNRVDQYSFNPNGETTNDGTNSYTWDGEGRLISAAGVTFAYDPDNLRVKKSSGKLYWRSISGDVLSETDLSGNVTNEFIYFAGQRMATVDSTTPTAHIYYHFRDHLGTAHTIVKDDGTVCYDADYYPFGGERLASTPSCSSTNKFTNYEHDSESGLEYAYYRYYSQASGRFISPDPIASNIGNPQALNRYTYVLNDPLNLADPRGLLTANCPVGYLGQPGVVIWVPCSQMPGEKGEKFQGGDWTYGFDSGAEWNVHGLKCPDGGYRPATGNAIWNRNCGVAVVKTGKKSQAATPACLETDPATSLQLRALSLASRITGNTLFLGLTASATATGGALKTGLGGGATIGVAADPQGNTGLVISGSLNGTIGTPGGNASFQIAASTYKTIYGFESYSFGYEAGGGDGLAVTGGYNTNSAGVTTYANVGAGGGLDVSKTGSYGVVIPVCK